MAKRRVDGKLFDICVERDVIIKRITHQVRVMINQSEFGVVPNAQTGRVARLLIRLAAASRVVLVVVAFVAHERGASHDAWLTAVCAGVFVRFFELIRKRREDDERETSEQKRKRQVSMLGFLDPYVRAKLRAEDEVV